MNPRSSLPYTSEAPLPMAHYLDLPTAMAIIIFQFLTCMSIVYWTVTLLRTGTMSFHVSLRGLVFHKWFLNKWARVSPALSWGVKILITCIQRQSHSLLLPHCPLVDTKFKCEYQVSSKKTNKKTIKVRKASKDHPHSETTHTTWNLRKFWEGRWEAVYWKSLHVKQNCSIIIMNWSSTVVKGSKILRWRVKLLVITQYYQPQMGNLTILI